MTMLLVEINAEALFRMVKNVCGFNLCAEALARKTAPGRKKPGYTVIMLVQYSCCYIRMKLLLRK